MSASVSTQAIYDRAAAQWVRTEKILLSDFTARPFALEALEPLAGTTVLDLGCGEGYVARQIRDRGAASLLGIELSEAMVAKAKAGSPDPQLHWRQGSATDLDDLPDASYDRVVAVFLFNYLTRTDRKSVV